MKELHLRATQKLPERWDKYVKDKREFLQHILKYIL